MEKQKRSLPGWLMGMAAGMVVVAVVAVALLIALRLSSQTPETDDAYDGITRIDPPRPMPDFTLTNQQGQPQTLAALRGQPVLLFFGFASCPDVCPLTMTEYQAIESVFGDRLHYVFISVDGGRDTPAVLTDFLARRGSPSFIGLTGDPADVRRIGADYGVTFEYGAADARGNYPVNHTPSIFVLDADGRWRMEFAFGMEMSVMIDALRELAGA
ncbi:MAG: SCO family protein [Anaerolineae bacterium]|nr:SCO family protein [Anaerolineae bacterium]